MTTQKRKLVMTEEEIVQLETILVELPFKHAQPIVQFLSSKLKADEDTQTDSPNTVESPVNHPGS